MGLKGKIAEIKRDAKAACRTDPELFKYEGKHRKGR